MKGQVKWFNEKKGYGFITPEDNSKDIFVHFKGISGDGYKTLKENQTVEFEVTQNVKGRTAINVVVLSDVPKDTSPK